MTHQQDTKGVRQVLEEVHKAHYDTIDGTDGCNVSIEKAESALQEIMLGMKPEKQKIVGDPLSKANHYIKGKNDTIDQIEQNIRGGFNNG